MPGCTRRSLARCSCRDPIGFSVPATTPSATLLGEWTPPSILLHVVLGVSDPAGVVPQRSRLDSTAWFPVFASVAGTASPADQRPFSSQASKSLSAASRFWVRPNLAASCNGLVLVEREHEGGRPPARPVGHRGGLPSTPSHDCFY